MADPGSLFVFDTPIAGSPVLSKDLRDNFEALARTNLTADPTKPAFPRDGMLRVLTENPANKKLQISLGGVWSTLLNFLGAGVPATSKQIFQFPVASTTWNITHNISSFPIVQVYDTLNNLLAQSVNNVTIATDDLSKFVAAPTVGNDANTLLTITNTPANDSNVMVRVNGTGYELGNGVKTKDCYFSGDAGVTARTIAAIAASDVFFWNGVISGFNLAVTDRIDFIYLKNFGLAGGFTLQHPTFNTTTVTHATATAGYAIVIG